MLRGFGMDIHVQYLYGLDIYANIKLLQFLIAFIYGNIIYILHGVLTWTYTLADLKFKNRADFTVWHYRIIQSDNPYS